VGKIAEKEKRKKLEKPCKKPGEAEKYFLIQLMPNSTSSQTSLPGVYHV
jgi:hypothetical protein